MQLWSLQIGQRRMVRETERGLWELPAVPLLALHRRRTVTFADRRLAEAVAARLHPRFPDACVRPYPGGPEDCLVLRDVAGVEEFLAAYGLGPLHQPATAAGAGALAWARQPGDPLDLPPAVAAARTDAGLVPALRQRLALGQVNPARVYALLGALGQPEGLDFLAWALGAEDDLEFAAKYGYPTREQTLWGVRALHPDAAAGFVRRALWECDHFYPWPVLAACVERLVRLGEPGLAALREIRAGHRLEAHIERWTAAALRRLGAGPDSGASP